MKVFISWSGDDSRDIATFLHSWLPSVLQNVRPYMSAENIDKGERWSLDIAKELQEAHYGVVCVTPDNIEAPWILFESGALSKSIEVARVSPIIFGLAPSELSKSPLLQFQLTQCTKDEIYRLMNSINSSAPDAERVSQDVLRISFGRAWSELEAAAKEIKFSKKADAQLTLDGSATLGISKTVDAALEELLSNTRSQLKLLNSPTNILPREYLNDIVRHLPILSRQIDADHPAWKDFWEEIETVNTAFAKLRDTKDADEFDSALSLAARAMSSLGRAGDYIYRRIYGRSFRGGGIASRYLRKSRNDIGPTFEEPGLDPSSD